METESGHDMHFTVDTEKYHCPICLLVLKDAIQTSCGHRFCKECIDRVLGESAVLLCPVDKQISRKNQVFPDVAIRREVLSLHVACSHAEDGCHWTGELREHESHGKVCKMATVACPKGCGVYDRRCDLESHLINCPLREIICRYCCENIVWRNIEDHMAECLKVPIVCEFCDAHGILREDLENHVNSRTGSCPETFVHCDFEDIGCNFFEKRSNLSRHMTDNTASSHHFRLMFETLCENKRENSFMKDKVGDLERKLGEIEQRLDDCSRTRDQLARDIASRNVSGQLHWKVDVRGVHRSPSGIYHSAPFYTGCPGYKIQVDMDTDCVREGNVRFSGIGLTLLRGEYDDQLMWPFNATCYVTLLDQVSAATRHRNRTNNIVLREVPRNRHNNTYDRIYKRSMTKFIKRQELVGPHSRFLKNGSLFLEVSVFHCCFPAPDASPIANVTPISLHAQNGNVSPVLNLASLAIV